MASVSATREKIIEAAHELFSCKGYQGTSTRDIAQHAGVAEVTLFRHFTTKETLFGVVIERLTTAAALEEGLTSIKDMPFENGVHLLAQRYLAKISTIRNWLNSCHADLQRGPNTLQQLYSSFMEQLDDTSTGYFRYVAERGEIRGYDSETVARVFMMLCFGYIQLNEPLLGNDGQKESEKQSLEAMVGIFVGGVTRHDARDRVLRSFEPPTEPQATISL